MNRHTNGPWELSEGGTSIWAKSPLGARVRLADIRVHASMNGIDHQANARVMVAAPELLAIAKLILKEWEAPTHDIARGELIARLSQYSEEARQAIAKAEGRK